MPPAALPRVLGAFAVFFTVMLPAFAATVATAVHAPLVELVSRKGFLDGGLAEFFFENFALALMIPGALAFGGGLAAFLVRRRADIAPEIVLGRLFVIQTLTSLMTFLWFSAYVVAAVKGQ